ncbi:hypothetical protein OOK29_10115 [Streptomyces phaeochromogenes]|uniref:hypothetical protein n=1 Tax=Streptomyces phaeochromogenes TaxID=1923 RepID=UPI0022529DAC|nr:hypothetical protein [Streptomyces phaeochromogenes]MCX5598494.1 hypothetical protein [Streptomyces phaeochromogenes]
MTHDPICGECQHPKSRHSDDDSMAPLECEWCTGPAQSHEFLPYPPLLSGPEWETRDPEADEREREIQKGRP